MARAPGSSFDVTVRQASLSYAGAALFQRLDFTLHGGQCTCLLGPSGVGKSSLLRLIAGLLAPEEGEVACSDQRPLAGRLAWMGQDADLLPWLPVMGNITLGARLRGERANPAAAEALLARVGLGGQRDQLPATLSGGQRQRAALARTLMEDRPVVLMDEPFSALDAITRARLQALAARLLQGRTVLLVTHDPLEALRLGHRIQVMAGQPARIEPPICPAGAPPRDLHDPALLARQGDLLARLADAQEAAA
ncbi:MAG TPA: ABC transporter ATP-binding protein [Geminicoccaceae bacterium]|nr:ABC transporter ATP-binding protein [Geminicoccaceae bacterium]